MNKPDRPDVVYAGNWNFNGAGRIIGYCGVDQDDKYHQEKFVHIPDELVERLREQDRFLELPAKEDALRDLLAIIDSKDA